MTALPDVLSVVTGPEPPAEGAEARLRRLEDREAIRQVLAAYCYLEDEHRWEQLVDLFTDDVERTLAGTLDETVRGRDALLQAYLAPTMRRSAAAGAGEAAAAEQLAGIAIRHLLTTDLVRFAPGGDRAWAVSYYQLVATLGRGDRFRRGAHEGTYWFELVRDGDRWRISRQVIWTDNATNPLFRAAAGG
jgi:hypothetical protein